MFYDSSPPHTVSSWPGLGLTVCGVLSVSSLTTSFLRPVDAVLTVHPRPGQWWSQCNKKSFVCSARIPLWVWLVMLEVTMPTMRLMTHFPKTSQWILSWLLLASTIIWPGSPRQSLTRAKKTKPLWDPASIKCELKAFLWLPFQILLCN